MSQKVEEVKTVAALTEDQAPPIKSRPRGRPPKALKVQGDAPKSQQRAQGSNVPPQEEEEEEEEEETDANGFQPEEEDEDDQASEILNGSQNTDPTEITKKPQIDKNEFPRAPASFLFASTSNSSSNGVGAQKRQEKTLQSTLPKSEVPAGPSTSSFNVPLQNGNERYDPHSNLSLLTNLHQYQTHVDNCAKWEKECIAMRSEKIELGKAIKTIPQEISELGEEIEALKASSHKSLPPNPAWNIYSPAEQLSYYESQAHQNHLDYLHKFKNYTTKRAEKKTDLAKKEKRFDDLKKDLEVKERDLKLARKEKEKLGRQLLTNGWTMEEACGQFFAMLRGKPAKRNACDSEAGIPSKKAKEEDLGVQQNGKAEK